MCHKNLLIFALLVSAVACSRILVVIPTPSISHQVVFRPLTQELAKRGHEVVVITADPAFPKGKAPENLKEIDVHDMSYKKFIKAFMDTSRGNKDDLIQQLDLLLTIFTDIFYDQLNTTEVKEIINGNEKFDLLILEAYLRPLLALSHRFKVPVILASSFGAISSNLDVIGAPSHPLLYPTLIQLRLYNLSMWEKIKELYTFYKFNKLLENSEAKEHEMMKEHFGSDLPSFEELHNNVDMLFLNVHPVFIGSPPVPPGVLYMFGIHRNSEKDLPQDIKNYLDSSKHGVVYVSFGSNTDPSKFSKEIINIFMRVFCAMQYDVLFKWDKEELPGKCQNVRIAKWFPQFDLLRHPKVKLFVTQGGMQSTDEAIRAGVPLIGIPMLADQWYNVEKYSHFKIGVKLDIETLTEEEFKNAVETVIGDESYQQNVKKLDQLMRDEPMPALERAVWWVEHVLRHGGARHLRSPAANISWAQYLELELVALLVFAIIISFALVLLLLKFVIRLVFSRKFKVD